MSRSIRQLLPRSIQNVDLVNAQARVPRALHDQVDRIRKENGWGWSDIVTACFEKFIHDLGERPKPDGSFRLKENFFDALSEMPSKSAWK